MLVVGVAFRNAEVVVFHSKALELARASHAPRGERAAFESQNERPRAMSVVSGAHVTAAGAARRLELTNSDGARARTRIAHGARRTRRARVADERPMSVASGACFAGAHGRHRTESSQRLSFELSSATRAANRPRRMMRASHARSGSENSLSGVGKAEASSRAVRAVAGLRRVRSTDKCRPTMLSNSFSCARL